MSNTIIAREFSLRPIDLIPQDDEDEMDQREQEYCAGASRLDTDTLMLLVAERFGDSDALRALVEDIKRHPFTPGARRTLHVSDGMRVINALVELLADAMDEQIEMQTACREGR